MEKSIVDAIIERTGDQIPKKTLILYSVCLILAVVIALIDLFVGRIDQLLLSVPIAIMLLVAIIADREVAHIPPLLIILMMIALVMVIISSEFKDSHIIINRMSSLLTGVCLMLMGLVVVYAMLHSSPEKQQEHKRFIHVSAFCIAMTVLLIMFVIECVYYHFEKYEGFELWVMTQYVIYAMVGAFVTSVLCVYGLDSYIIKSNLNRNLEVYQNSEYSNEFAKQEALEIIQSGESEKLEFKSTITTNIRTGENDKRMEKAVLKTIVAFLNTSGGILMIGVSDDGSIYGVDENVFDSRDKMNLHLTHMISSKIGDEFFPYISFRNIDMEEGKSIIRVDCFKCKKPVFVKEGKTEEFYVRSGPSSVELTGSNLVNYVKNKSSKERQSMVRGIRATIEDD